MNRSDDLALFEVLCQGNRAALNTLFTRYYESLCQFAYQLLKNRMDAEEVVSDVFFQIWTSRENLHIERSVRAYLFTATRHACLAQSRKRSSSMVIVREEAAETVPVTSTPESILQDAESHARITAVVEQLPHRVREVFVLSRWEGLSYSEIAAVLEISEKTVEGHISKALVFLRDQLLGPSVPQVTSRNKAVTIT